jgi:hypothetical protein
MATDAIVVLQTLRCVELIRGEQRTEPYIWPVVLRVDDNTLTTPELLDVFAPAIGSARVIIKDGMRAGESATIPGEVGIRRVRFDDNLLTRRLILVVALFEMDDTPQKAMRAGFEAFKSELGAAVAEKLFDLNATDEEAQKPIIEEIKKRVEDRVKSAISDGLSAFEKAKVLAGILNLDDPSGSDVKAFGEEGLNPTAFSLTFNAERKVLDVVISSSHFEIDGQLLVRPVVVDRCQPQVDAVNAALAVVNGIEKEIEELQSELQGGGDGPPRPKSDILDEIERIREEELQPAEAALEQARAALKACRDRLGALAQPPGGSVVTA